MGRDLVIGADAGGTATRCVAVSLDGEVVGRGAAGGANPYSSADPAVGPAQALRQALGGISRERIRGGVIGVAGAAASERAGDTVRQIWSDLNLGGGLRVCDDIVVAFASGSAEPEGTVLIAGTGAVAAHVRDGTVVRRCDGYGWLLGDEGSAVWIALAGLRAVLAASDGRGRPTVLCERLPAELGVSPRNPRPLYGAVYSKAPAELGRLAPLVSRAAADGDAVAADIVSDAAERLLASVACLAPEPDRPLVLAGSVLEGGPVAEAVRRGLRDRLKIAATAAGDGALGAASLALRELGAPAGTHTALLNRTEPVSR